MDTALLDAALTQGIWAAVAIFLLIYIVKANEKLNAKQTEREEKYQFLLQELTEKFQILNEIKADINDISEKLDDEDDLLHRQIKT